jgi:dTDP-4-dehydrorhamnose reductase
VTDTFAPPLADIDRRLWDPPPGVLEDLDALDGDLVVLGAGGKMGFSLCRMAVEAARRGRSRRVVAVSRFGDAQSAAAFEDAGIEVHRADLLEEADRRELPDAPNVVFLVGRKFGTQGAESATWAVNTFLPGQIAARYRDSRIVALSSGNVYPLTPVVGGGATEATPPGPIGEYAQSCLGRERILEHASRTAGTPMALVRLNYAIDLRYGVLHDLAQRVCDQQPVDLSMGCVNVVWQGDANAVVLRSLLHCDSPPAVLNLTGPETISVRWLATELGRRLGVEPTFVGEEAGTALLSNAGLCHQRFGYPSVPLLDMLDWTVEWIQGGGPSLDKPTHFQQRVGAF